MVKATIPRCRGGFSSPSMPVCGSRSFGDVILCISILICGGPFDVMSWIKSKLEYRRFVRTGTAFHESKS